MTQPRRSASSRTGSNGFTLVESLIALALTAVIAVLSINMIVGRSANTQDTYSHETSDFIQHLTAACQKSRLEYGAGPLAAKTIGSGSCSAAHPDCNLWAYPQTPGTNNLADTPQYSYTGTNDNNLRGIGWLLKNWDSTVTYDSTNQALSYPGGMILYLQPDLPVGTGPNVDPNGEIPDDASGINGTATNPETATLVPGTLDDIMYNSTNSVAKDDRQFLLLDLNGTPAPNSIASSGDRVLLYVEDKTCRVRTAYQACRDGTMATCNQAYTQSFYDVYECNMATKAGLTSSFCNPQTSSE